MDNLIHDCRLEFSINCPFFPFLFLKFTLCYIFLQSRTIWSKSFGCQIYLRVLVQNILIKVIPFCHSNIVFQHRYSNFCCFPHCYCCVRLFPWVFSNDFFYAKSQKLFFFSSRICTNIWKLYLLYGIYFSKICLILQFLGFLDYYYQWYCWKFKWIKSSWNIQIFLIFTMTYLWTVFNFALLVQYFPWKMNS